MYTIFCGYSGYLPEGSRTGIESLEELRAALMEELEFHASGMNPEYEDDKLAIESIVSEISRLGSVDLAELPNYKFDVLYAGAWYSYYVEW